MDIADIPNDTESVDGLVDSDLDEDELNMEIEDEFEEHESDNDSDENKGERSGDEVWKKKGKQRKTIIHSLLVLDQISPIT